MKTTTQTTIFIIFLFIGICPVLAQKKIETGITTGAIRFYPEGRFANYDSNNSMENGFGWSAGIFLENHWKPKLHPIFEFNYYTFLHDIYLYEQLLFEAQYISQNFKNEPFNYLSFSLGVKGYLGKKIFVYPSLEVARSLNNRLDYQKLISSLEIGDYININYMKAEYRNKIIYYAKLGVGVNLNEVNILLEYAYGFNYQMSIYDYSVPLGFIKRNNYLQLKVQIPLLQLK